MLSHIPSADIVRARARAALAFVLVAAAPSLAAAAPQSQAAGAAPPSSAEQQAADPVVAASLREAASRDSAVIKGLVYQSEQEMAGSGQSYDLSLLDAVEMALRNNLSVQVSRYQPDNSFEGIRAARSGFDTTLSFSLPNSFSRGTTPQTTQIAGADAIVSQNVNGGFQWQENLEWGTSYNLSWNSTRSSSNSTFNTFNPTISSNVRGSITQPLLRGFGDVNRTGIYVAMNSYESSLEGFRAQVQGILLQTIQAYWNLRAQNEVVRVREQALDLAQQQLTRNRIQVEIGTLAPIETVQAETSAANAELNLIAAQRQLEDAQDQLRQLLNFDAIVDDPFGYDLIPTDELETTFDAIDLEEAIRLALENDPGLAQQRYNARSADLGLDQARNNLLPNLSVTGSFNLQGRGGDRIIRGGLGEEGTEIIATGFGTAVSQIFSGDFNTWSVGATLSFPLHNYAAKAGHARAQISQRQALTQLDQQRQTVVYLVRQRVRGVENLVEQVQTATLTRELSERQLRAEERKFEVGTSTNFNVLTFQNQFANAQLSELQTIVQLQNAIAQLEQAKGTLLESFGVALGDAGRGVNR